MSVASAGSAHGLGHRLMARLDRLAQFSDDRDQLTRLYLTPEHKAAALQVQTWMVEAGMSASIDAVGNASGRYESAAPDRPALLLGSHIDTVRNAGKYDGALGVLVAIAAVEELNWAGERLPFALEVFAFGDEEGVRFPVTLTGSRAVAGTLDPAALDAEDAEGISLREALQRFGCDPLQISGLQRRRAVLGYIEVHIEQGPILEAEDLPLGVVTAINGASRFALEVTGEAGHAGTVPMRLRKDALAAAAEMVLAIERRASATPDLVATVGRLEALPGAVNVIPGTVRFTLDVRAPADALRAAVTHDLEQEVAGIAARRQVRLEISGTYDVPAATCAPQLIGQLEAAVARAGIRPLRLPSGAGHDALAMADLCPVGMLFIRCKGGISHNPAESVTIGDAGTAVRVLLDFLRHFEPAGAGRHREAFVP
jgi:allantoate deiminase